MCRRNEVDVMTTTRLQLQKHFREALVSHFVFDLLFVSLRYPVVLAIHAAEIAVAEEHVTGTFCSDQRRLLAEMRRVRRDDRQPAGVASSDLVVQTIVQTVARADRAALQQLLALSDRTLERPTVQQRAIGWYSVIH